MNRPLLSIKGITKVYSGKNSVRALDGVSLTIDHGEIFGLLGVNGAGKTTLSSIIATLHPPTSGDILFHGKSIYQNLVEFRKALGFCPQHQNLDQFLTVRENLIFAGRYFLMPETKIQKRVDMLIEQLQLTRYANFNINALSGGNKQRVLIARALVHEPQLVILDEPTVGLDPDIRRALWNLIKDLKKLNISVILTTHYLDEAEYLSDRICILDKGKIILIDTLKTIKETHGMAGLEDIFLKLLKQQREGK
ncbi:ABC transporter ATP-binding protein [Candidatus Dependentiae bacterium]|nr:ABC transporter ATP-binding protein [Candidatus Dependentiae bacterium]